MESRPSDRPHTLAHVSFLCQELVLGLVVQGDWQETQKIVGEAPSRPGTMTHVPKILISGTVSWTSSNSPIE